MINCLSLFSIVDHMHNDILKSVFPIVKHLAKWTKIPLLVIDLTSIYRNFVYWKTQSELPQRLITFLFSSFTTTTTTLLTCTTFTSKSGSCFKMVSIGGDSSCGGQFELNWWFEEMKQKGLTHKMKKLQRLPTEVGGSDRKGHL